MPVIDFTDLVTTTSEYIGRADIGAVVNRFVAMAELDIERSCQFEEQHASTLLALVAGRATLPVNLHMVRSVATTGSPSQTIKRVSKHFEHEPSEFNMLGYTMDGNEIVVFPKSIEQVRLSYFAKIPRLSAAQPTNWLMTIAPDVLLAGTVYHALVWAADARAEPARLEFSERMKMAVRSEKSRRFTNAVIAPVEGMP